MTENYPFFFVGMITDLFIDKFSDRTPESLPANSEGIKLVRHPSFIELEAAREWRGGICLKVSSSRYVQVRYTSSATTYSTHFHVTSCPWLSSGCELAEHLS